MAKSLLNEAGVIQEIHGRVGNFLYTVRNGVQHVRMISPREYQRRTKLTKKEKQAREMFARVQGIVTELKAKGDPRPRPEIFKEEYKRLKEGRDVSEVHR